MSDRPRTCVVISYWNGRTIKPLYRLLSQMRKIDAGADFDTVIVCNGGDKVPLRLPARFDDLRPRLFDRENVGYNIAAWDHGWRSAGDYESFLFIQDDCFLKSRSWVSRFEHRFDQDPGIGLLGEHVVNDQMTWEFIRRGHCGGDCGPPETWPEELHFIAAHESRFRSRGIPWPECSDHLPSIILFSRRRVLEEIGGFPYFGPSYQEGISSELAISGLVKSKGYRVSKVTDHPFELIGHPQWTSRGKTHATGVRAAVHEAWWKSKSRIRNMIGHKDKAQRLGAGR